MQAFALKDVKREFSQDRMDDYEVAIVGGGISGLYCAKKLKDSGVKGIVVLERSNRWGGRLDTDIINIDGGVIKEEKGAMRFTYQDPDGERKSNMPLLSRLIKDLGMENEIEPFYMKPQPVSIKTNSEVKDCNSNYFAERHFTNHDAEQNPSRWGDLYDLKNEEESKCSGQIINDIYRKLLEENTEKVISYFNSIGRGDVAEKILEQTDVQCLLEHQDARYWAFFRNEFVWPVGSKRSRLRDISLIDLVKAMNYSDACCQMIVKTLFDGEETQELGNAGALLQFNINSSNLYLGDNLYHFKNGWSSLVNRIKLDLHGETSTVKLMDKIDVYAIQEERDGFVLQTHCGKNTIRAKHVVLAIPPGAAKAILTSNQSKLDLSGTSESAAVEKVYNATVGEACVKIILYFNNDWWNNFDDVILFGPNSTDLPCGFVYPYYKQFKGERDGGDIQGPNQAALTIYCGSTRAKFWRESQRQGEKFHSTLQRENTGLIPASELVVYEAINQLKKVFNVEEVPNPILTSFRSWDGEGDHGYAYHYWGLGVDDLNLETAQPVEGKNLYLCSEAWSGYQGYVEGALMSTENVYNKILRNMTYPEN